MKILLVEDDFQLSSAIETFLKIKNYQVEAVHDGENAIDCIDNRAYDLYITDINLPNVTGLDIVKYIRQKDKNSPIIMITASSEVNNFSQAYENGCDEYLKKPFHLKELEVLIDKLFKNNQNDILKIDTNTNYNMKFEELVVYGRLVLLRKKERKLLHILLLNLGHTVKNEDIINFVWENEIREQYPLRQLVNEMRNKLPHAKDFIKTEVGVGYRFEN